MEKINNLKNKTPEEVVNVYKEIALKNEILKEIWNNTDNYEQAEEVYKTYIKEKEKESKHGKNY